MPRSNSCVYRKLDSAISVVKPIENRSRDDGTKALDRSMNGSVLVQGAMRPRFIIIVRVGLKDPAQVPLAQGDDIIDALATDRSDQPLGEAVLPRRARRNGLVTDAHGSQSAGDGGTVDSVPIADQVARGLIPRERLRDLTCNPFRGRVCRDVDPDQGSAFLPDDDQDIEQVEADGWNNEQVHGADIRRMVAQKGEHP